MYPCSQNPLVGVWVYNVCVCVCVCLCIYIYVCLCVSFNSITSVDILWVDLKTPLSHIDTRLPSIESLGLIHLRWLLTQAD